MTLKKAFTETDFMEKYIAYFSNDTSKERHLNQYLDQLCAKKLQTTFDMFKT